VYVTDATRVRACRELISEKQYDRARALLHKVKDDPLAIKWLEKLDEIDPAQVVVENNSAHEPAASPWQYAGLEVKRSYGIQYKVNGLSRAEWKDQPIYYVLNEMGRDGWELASLNQLMSFRPIFSRNPV